MFPLFVISIIVIEAYKYTENILMQYGDIFVLTILVLFSFFMIVGDIIISKPYKYSHSEEYTNGYNDAMKEMNQQKYDMANNPEKYTKCASNHKVNPNYLLGYIEGYECAISKKFNETFQKR
jgi:hypothetical protein